MKQPEIITRKQIREIEAALQINTSTEKQIAILTRAQELADGNEYVIGIYAIIKRRIIWKAAQS